MNKYLSDIYKHNSFVFRWLLFIVAVVFLVNIFPKKPIFPYEFQKGETWAYKTLRAKFKFSVLENEATFQQRRLEINKRHKKIYSKETADIDYAYLKKKLSEDSTFINTDLIITKIKTYYEKGIISDKVGTLSALYFQNNRDISLVKTSHFVRLSELKNDLKEELPVHLVNLSLSFIKPNIQFNNKLSKEVLKEELHSISPYVDLVNKGEIIVSNGQVIDALAYQKLYSYQKDYNSKLEDVNQWLLALGYIVLTGLVFAMLYLYLYYFEKEIFYINKKLIFIILNIVGMVVLAIFFARWYPTYFYVLPFCIVPVVITAFMNSYLGIMVHLLSCVLIAFFVPHSFEFIFLQLFAGIITILTDTNLHKRTNLFIAVVKIVVIYEVSYLGFELIREGNIENVNFLNLVLFFISGLLSLLAQPLIYIYEKTFGMMSDISLLELSDANNELLRKLSEEAPGTMQHSLQVANLAEEAAKTINANVLLVRIGALYHDIGKTENPRFFIENQQHNINPHDELSAIKSAKIIINHVALGVKIAKKHKLPDRIIDFIRTHHGQSTVYYFYKKHQEENPDIIVDKADFSYPGPLPFSKETAILMMCDAVEAASKSLKNPSNISLQKLVFKIIEKQLEEGQFDNSDLSLKEIGQIKTALYNKLINIYHTRIEYPD